jgi:predicted porin
MYRMRMRRATMSCACRGSPNLFYLGAAYQITPAFTLDGEVFRITNAEQDARVTMGTLRGAYSLSKATAVYLQGSYLSNSSQGRYSLSSGGGGTTPPAGENQTGLIGIRHAF